MKRFLILLMVLAPPVAAADAVDLVFCAPGYPGSTAEAQPTMDALAAGLVQAAGWDAGSLQAVYHEDGPSGLTRLQQDGSGLAMVTLPFFLRHQAELELDPLLAGVPSGAGDGSWSLVALKGLLAKPQDLEGWTVTGLPAYHPGLVDRLLAGWGALPGGAAVQFSSRPLSALRKAARGDPVAVLLDRAQVEALPALPYGESLEVVHRSGPVPASLLCSVRNRVPAGRLQSLVAGLRTLHESPFGKDLLESVRMERFVDPDPAVLSRLTGEPD